MRGAPREDRPRDPGRPAGGFAVRALTRKPDSDKARALANMAQAAREAGLSHVIWSTLEDTRRWVPLEDEKMPTLKGKWKVPHFDGKGEADHLFADAGVPTTYLDDWLDHNKERIPVE